MDPERWQQIKLLFEAVRQVPDGERSTWLRERCGDDDELIGEVRSLLDHDRVGSSFIDSPALGGQFSLASTGGAGNGARGEAERPGARIGPYELIREIGAGGMGVVYEAQQLRPHRLVALKVLRTVPGHGDEALRRFQRETETLGRLRHPGIATIIESGRTDDDRHYLAMELVQGRDLRTYLKEEQPPRRARLELFLGIVEAVSYAHQRGVIHRDLKPSNILVDEQGRPKILDFGLARITDTDVSLHTLVTEVGRIVGTLAYMSPEQARGNPHDVDVRADVYALGVILFEALSGMLPYDVPTTSMPQALAVICEQPPQRLGGIAPGLRGDLETIVGKALEKDPERRYASAAALEDDVRRHLADQPILARPPSATYQLGKLIRRHTVPFALAVALFVLSVGFGLFSTVQAVKLANAVRQADDELYRSRIAQAQLHLNEPNITGMLEVLEQCDPQRRGWEWNWLAAQANLSELDFSWDDTMVHAVNVRPPRLDVVRFDRTRGLHVWDAAADALVYAIDGHDAGVPHAVFSRDGRLLATGDEAGVVLVRDAGDGRLLRRIEAFEGAVSHMAFTVAGDRIVVAGGIPDPFSSPLAFAAARSQVGCWSIADGSRLCTLESHDVISAMTLTADDRMLAWGNQNGVVEVYDLLSGEQFARKRMPRNVTSLAWMRDGAELILALTDTTIRIWTLEDDNEFVWRDHERALASVAVSPNRSYVASGDVGGTLRIWHRLWQPKRGEVLSDAPAHDETRWVVDFTADSRWVTTWAEGGQVKFWKVPGHDSEPAPDEVAVTSAFAMSPDRAHVVTTSGTSKLAIMSVVGDTATRRFGNDEAKVLSLAASDDAIASGDASGRVCVWSPSDLRAPELVLDDHDAPVTCLAYVPRTGELISGSADGRVVLRRGGPRETRCVEGLTCMAVAPDGWTIACAGTTGLIELIDVAAGAVRQTLTGHTGSIRTVAFDTEGGRLVTAGDDRTVRIWDAADGSPLAVMRGHEGDVYAAVFTPDGSRVISGGNELRIWHAERGTHLLLLRWGSHLISDIRVLSDRRILTRSFSGALRVWDARRVEAREDVVAELLQFGGP